MINKFSVLLPLYRSRLFLIVLIVKIILGSLFGSDVLVHGFIPFVTHFIQSGFANPYDAFLKLGELKAFPYPPVMLWIFTVPVLMSPFLTHQTAVTSAHLFAMRLPLLAADILIYTILCQWLVTKEKQVLWLYWCSPIILYVSYYHGQLDIIPTALLLLSVYLLTNGKLLGAFTVLALGLATKSHLLLALPIYIIYLTKKPVRLGLIAGYLTITLGLYLLFLSPYLGSPGFQQLVLRAEEQSRFWALSFSFPPGMTIYLAIAAYLVLLLRLTAYKRLSQDALLVFLGLMFTILVVLVPPSPGWYVWAIPFLAFFFIKFNDAPLFTYVTFTTAYLLFFIFSPTSDIFTAWQVTNPVIAAWPTPYAFLEAHGITSQILATSLFTIMQTSLVMTAYWTYRTGVKSHLERSLNEKSVFIGIGGDSGAGKTTLAGQLVDLVGEPNVLVIQGDDTHKWPRGHKQWEVYTHLNPKGNHLHLDADNLFSLQKGMAVKRASYNHTSGEFMEPTEIKPKRFMIVEGLHPFYLTRTRRLYDIKIYVEPSPDLRLEWKLARDMKERGHTPAAIQAQMEARHADSTKFISPQGQFADIIVRYRRQNEADPESPLLLEIVCDNSLDLEPVVEAFTARPSLTLEHRYEENLHHQLLQFQGSVSSEVIQEIAYRLLPNIEEIIGNRPTWHADYAGINQLMVGYYYAYTIERYA